jgi:hypothetical protein
VAGVDLFAATQLALLQARKGEWTSAAKMLFEVAERSKRRGAYFETIGALGDLAVLLAAMGADDAALLLGVWSESNYQANLDT